MGLLRANLIQEALRVRNWACVSNSFMQHATQYSNLSIEKISQFLQQYPEIAQYLPDAIEIPRLPKEYLANVAYTVIKKPFADWVKAQINARNEKIITDQQLEVELDPELVEAFNASTHVSSKKSSENPPEDFGHLIDGIEKET